MHSHPPVPYAAIKHHGVIGDRRTAALVAADGSIDWFALPDYDGNIIFGALLDAQKGGYWHLGPNIRQLGAQSYLEDTTSLKTIWDLREGQLELTDFMAWPGNQRPAGREKHRAILRRLRCAKGRAPARLLLCAACDFKPVEPTTITDNTVSLRTGKHDIELWTNRPVKVHPSGVEAEFQLKEGEEFWCVLACGHRAADWNEKKAAEAMAESERYWKQWTDKLSYDGPRRSMVRRSAILVHQMGYAPDGSHVAAPTTSLPERIGGDWNCDYRLCWIRDTSLSLEILILLGDKEGARRYLEWLSGLQPSPGDSFQVVYGIHGEKKLSQEERKDLQGYRRSKPVRLGNRAYQQDQHGSMGYLVDCIHLYLEGGGDWRPEFWDLVHHVAEHICEHWKDPSNSIWELPVKQHYLSGKVLGWVALDRALKIAKKLGKTEKTERWRGTRRNPCRGHGQGLERSPPPGGVSPTLRGRQYRRRRPAHPHRRLFADRSSARQVHRRESRGTVEHRWLHLPIRSVGDAGTAKRRDSAGRIRGRVSTLHVLAGDGLRQDGQEEGGGGHSGSRGENRGSDRLVRRGRGRAFR